VYGGRCDNRYVYYKAFMMFQILKIGVVLSACIHLASCYGQSPDRQLHVLSEDFDKSMPFYYGMPDHLSAIDTSPVWKDNGQQIVLTGTVYQIDGKTPAPDVILYYYQTDINGRYTTKEDEERNMPKNGLGQTHGYIRGWLKTDAQGNYAIYTMKPGTYPSRDEPAHIHMTIKEKDIRTPYYIDDFVFDDDPLLTTVRRKRMDNRGGSGVIRFVEKEGNWIGERNIILGLNIPNYPKREVGHSSSGINIGEDILSFTPHHAYGADKGTQTCPICKYGWYHGILYFVGNNPNWEAIKKWLVFLDNQSKERAQYLKAYFVYGKASEYHYANRMHALEKLGDELALTKVALTFVPSLEDKKSDIYLNGINPNVESTILIYRRSNVIDKYIDLEPNQDNFDKIIKRLDETANAYFKLPKPERE